MAMAERLDQHGSEKFDNLFEENTGEPGSLGEVVDKHAGDAVILSDEESGIGKGADGGLADLVGELGQSDPADDSEESDDDAISGDAVSEVDITGSTPGVARGFGSHVALDLGAGGFEIEDIPQRVLPNMQRPHVNEELDDYDDDNPNNGKYDPKDLELLSVPGSKIIDEDSEIADA
jgi:hypothetical protein